MASKYISIKTCQYYLLICFFILGYITYGHVDLFPNVFLFFHRIFLSVTFISYFLLLISAYSTHDSVFIYVLRLHYCDQYSQWDIITERQDISDSYSYYIVRCMNVYRRALDWWMDLLTIYTPDS
jgi:hypothetical protein